MASHSLDHDHEQDSLDQKSPVVTPTSIHRPSYEQTRWSHSPAGVLASQDVDGLSLYDQKCVLVNREIDAMGMGRYQWYIWCLCGFGYLLDLLWAQAFGLALSPLQQELGFGNDVSGNISTSFSAGLTAGAFFWGVMSDMIGKLSLPVDENLDHGHQLLCVVIDNLHQQAGDGPSTSHVSSLPSLAFA